VGNESKKKCRKILGVAWKWSAYNNTIRMNEIFNIKNIEKLTSIRGKMCFWNIRI
jgi:hypothetical protein